MNVPGRTSHHLVRPSRRHRYSLVRRVREILRAQIVQHGFRDGILPSELQLVTEYGVSRGVIREVLGLLRWEGLIDRLQGAGTFVVAQDRSPVGIDTANSLTEGIERGGSRLSWDVLELGCQQAPALVADRLELAREADVVFVERLTMLDGHPLMVRTSWFPLAVGAALLRPFTELLGSVYDLIEEVLGQNVAFARLQAEAARADQSIAGLLELDVGAPVQLMERVMYTPDARPLEYSVARARGDRFVLTTVMQRRRCEATGRPARQEPTRKDRTWAEQPQRR